ncbi:MAG: response regulator transcription factor [Tissierellia bacterium]|nr:response regulator transcription factor [Tissierellia bacterium]
MGKKVLVVDDEKNIVELIQMNLETSGFQVIPAYTGKEALEKTISLSPDLILLDLMLPDIDGFEVCRMIKTNEETKDIPIIMITAKSEETDKVIGLGLGADDYVTKPFSIRELEARIKTVLRRCRKMILLEDSIKKPSNIIIFKDLSIDLTKYQVERDGKKIDFTLTEFKILKTLLENQDRVMSRESLLKEILGDKSNTDIRTVDVHIRNIRKKLENNGGNPYEYIETVRGIGYRMK